MGQRGNQLRFAGILFANHDDGALSGGSGVGHGKWEGNFMLLEVLLINRWRA